MTQNDAILRYLTEQGSITPLDAMREFGCMRLSARIADLRALGHDITTELVVTKNRYGHNVGYAKYTLKRGA